MPKFARKNIIIVTSLKSPTNPSGRKSIKIELNLKIKTFLAFLKLERKRKIQSDVSSNEKKRKKEKEREKKSYKRHCLCSPLSEGADHYRRAQNDARISAGGASANNLILHTDCYLEGLLFISTVGLNW